MIGLRWLGDRNVGEGGDIAREVRGGGLSDFGRGGAVLNVECGCEI